MRARYLRQSGYSLFELAVILSVASLLLAGIWVAASTALNAQKKVVLEQDVVQIIRNAKNIFGDNVSDLGTVTTDDAIQAQVFPANWHVTDNGTVFLRQPYATRFDMNSASLTSNGGFLRLQIGIPRTLGTGLPSDVCVILVSHLATAAGFKNYGFLRIYILGGDGGNSSYGEQQMPLTVGTIAGACTVGDRNAVALLFDVP